MPFAPTPDGFALNTAALNGSRAASSVIPIGFTDPNAARVIVIALADPKKFQTDPNAARVVVIASSDPSKFQTDPNAARVI